MSQVTGFFTRLSAKEAAKKKGKKKKKDLSMFGLDLAGNMNPNAKTPNMAPILTDSDVLLLGEHPTKQDDINGKPFSDKWGNWYKNLIQGEVSCDNIVRTLPKGKLTDNEIAAFRETVLDTVYKLKPKYIIACGAKVIKWLSPGDDHGDFDTRGRTFVIKIKDHVCWATAVLPNCRARIYFAKDFKSSVYGPEYQDVTKRDLQRAFPQTEPPNFDISKEGLLEDVTIYMEPRPDVLLEFDKTAGDVVFLDIECFGRLPYSGDKIQSIALTAEDGKTITMPIHHPRVRASSLTIREVFDNLTTVLRGRRVVIHNAVFELQWLIHEIGSHIAFIAQWFCTQKAQHSIDVRPGKALDYLTRMYLGFSLKSMSPERLWDKPHMLKEMLEYNAFDTKYLRHVYLVQQKVLKERNIRIKNDMFIQPALAMMMTKGINTDQEAVEEIFHAKSRENEVIIEEIRNSPEGMAFRDLKVFDFENNDDHMKVLLHDILLKGGTKGRKLNKEILQEHEHIPHVQRLQNIRKTNTLLSTYIRRSRVSHPETYIHADGLIHPQVLPSNVVSGRLSTREPNLNWPKRDPEMKKVRKVVKAPAGMRVVSVDQGQIEGRAIACLSEDEDFCDKLNKGLDIHMAWAERINEVYPEALEARGNDMDTLRGDVKGAFVFAHFFGSGPKNVAQRMNMPFEVVKELSKEFWETHHGVKDWHNRIQHTYKKKFYVENLFGQKFNGPLGYNQLINIGVQSSAAFLCLYALAKLSRIGAKQKKPWLTMLMNIHDDNTTFCPESEVEESAYIMAKTMCLYPEFPQIIVPLTATAEEGPDWYNMTKIKEYETKDFL